MSNFESKTEMRALLGPGKRGRSSNCDVGIWQWKISENSRPTIETRRLKRLGIRASQLTSHHWVMLAAADGGVVRATLGAGQDQA